MREMIFTVMVSFLRFCLALSLRTQFAFCNSSVRLNFFFLYPAPLIFHLVSRLSFVVGLRFFFIMQDSPLPFFCLLHTVRIIQCYDDSWSFF